MNRYKFLDKNKEHLHTLNEKPLLGTTTVLKVVSKELTWWASGMACAELGWLKSLKKDRKASQEEKDLREAERILRANDVLIKLADATAEQYVALLDKAYRAHNQKMKDRAEEGTDLHALAEEWIKWRMGKGAKSLTIDPKLKPFIEWCEKNVKRFLFSEIHCFSERLWTGGGTDFGFERMDGALILSDIKSRDKDYFTDHLQCGGYDIQLSENLAGFDAEGNVIWTMDKPFDYHAIFTLGDNFKEPVYSHSVVENKQGFEFAVGLYKIKQAYEARNK